jgi:zinc transport system ATP-binding protein
MASNPVIVIENVSFSYNDEPVIEDANLTISEREFVWIVGPNGGGKTTLVKIMLGLLRPRKGRVTVFGASASTSRRRIGYMPQHAQGPIRARIAILPRGHWS